MSGTKIPTFTTERLLLRGVEPRDIPSYQKHFNDYAVISQLAHVVPWPFPENGVETFLQRVFPVQGKERWLWGIFEKNNADELIGVVDLWRDGRPEHRGFWLARKHWGKGYMTEAVTPVMDFAFDQLGFEKMILSNAVGNHRSHRVKAKTGARLIGTRPMKFVDPKYTEAETWELTKEEWQKFRSSKTIKRKAARAVLVNDQNEILMIQLLNREMNWEGWITPGGGMEPGETEENALRREMHEELGLSDFKIGPQVFERTHQLTWDGQFIEQSEKYFLVRTKKFEPKFTLELTELEKSALGGFKWWSLVEIEASNETFAPAEITKIVRRALDLK